jgi:hypothetical protein
MKADVSALNDMAHKLKVQDLLLFKLVNLNI